MDGRWDSGGCDVVALVVALVSLAVSFAALAAALCPHGEVLLGNPHAKRLGQHCVVTIGGHSYLATCVAVGWHGAVAVRGMTPATSNTVWVPKGEVEDHVRWCDDG